MPPQKQILVVDDDPSHLQLYCWILEGGGHSAFPLLAKGRSVTLPDELVIDLAVLDYNLGLEFTALDIVQPLRTKFPALPIVVLSEREWIRKEIEQQVSAYVAKGDPQKLLDTIQGLLQSN
jgi:CheY-like chemotaxis protein